MSIFQRCLKKSTPRPNDMHSFLQQEFVFEDSTQEGLFIVYEQNIHHKELVFRCYFPSFYQDYLSRLVNRRSLYIKMWQRHDNKALKSLPDFGEIFKYLRHLVDFTDRVVDLCLKDAKSEMASSIWVPKLLREWLILEFNVGHGFQNAQDWVREHQGQFSEDEPSEYSTFRSYRFIQY
jgi:hypothetical protein